MELKITSQRQTAEELKIKLQRHFAELKFESGVHSYHIGERKLISVSGFIKKYTPIFNADMIAGFVARSRGITKEEVLAEWEESKNIACDLGTTTHLFGETYPVMGGTPSTPFEEGVVSFWDTLPSNYIPICFELQMYCKKKGIAGTGDIVLLNTLTNKLVIVDYKTNKDLFKNHKKQKLLGAFSHLLDMPLSKYGIQLSFYQILIEQIEDIEVEERWLIWLKPDGTFEKILTPDMRDIIEQEFNF